MNFYKSLQNPKFLGIIFKCLRCAALPQASLAIYVILLMARGTSSGSCPMQQFWVAALFFAVSLPTSDCPPRTLTYRLCGQAQHPLLVIGYRVAAENRKRHIMRNPSGIMKEQ